MSYIDDEHWYVVRDSGGVVVAAQGGGDAGSWVRIPTDVFDALVLMRYAQLIETAKTAGRWEDYVQPKARKVCEQYPSLGSEALRRWVGLPSLLDDIINHERTEDV